MIEPLTTEFVSHFKRYAEQFDESLNPEGYILSNELSKFTIECFRHGFRPTDDDVETLLATLKVDFGNHDAVMDQIDAVWTALEILSQNYGLELDKA